MTRTRALLVGAALLFSPFALDTAQAQTGGQEPPVGTEMPSTQHQQGVLKPVPDLHGRAGGEGQAHGNDATSPTAEGAAAAAPEGPCGTALPGTKHQKESLKTAQDCMDQGSAGVNTGADGVPRAQPGNQPVTQQ
jgi:hypothetical protein